MRLNVGIATASGWLQRLVRCGAFLAFVYDDTQLMISENVKPKEINCDDDEG
jgi:hypothetical protein